MAVAGVDLPPSSQRPTLEGVVDWIDLDTICLLFGMVSTSLTSHSSPLTPPPSLLSDDTGGYFLPNWVL